MLNSESVNLTPVLMVIGLIWLGVLIGFVISIGVSAKERRALRRRTKPKPSEELASMDIWPHC